MQHAKTGALASRRIPVKCGDLFLKFSVLEIDSHFSALHRGPEIFVIYPYAPLHVRTVVIVLHPIPAPALPNGQVRPARHLFVIRRVAMVVHVPLPIPVCALHNGQVPHA